VSVSGDLSVSSPSRRCPERIATSYGKYARCHRPPGHPGPCHAAGRSWHPTGEAGQRLRIGAAHFPDCLPVPEPPIRPGRGQRPANRGRATRRRIPRRGK